MDDSIGTGGPLAGYTPDYVRRLLVERRLIYEKLYNPGGSVILRSYAMVDHERPVGYSTEIGNTFHLDLIQLDIEFRQLVEDGLYSKKEISAILTWADGMNSREAADYLSAKGPVSVRKLRSRATKKLQDRMNDSGPETPRGSGDGTS